jgi:hypothetical protein
MATDYSPATISVTDSSSGASPMTKSNAEYSTLEVDHDRWLESQRSAPEAVHNPGEEKIIAEPHVWPIVNETATDPESKNRLICGLQPRTFWIISVISLFLLLAAAVGGGVGGSLAAKKHRNHRPASTPSATTGPTKIRPVYQNTGLAAMQWVDLDGINHYRVYYQDASNAVQESAWDSNDTSWQVSQVSDPTFKVKPGTPIAAAAGYPHANHSYTLVRDSLSLSRRMS